MDAALNLKARVLRELRQSPLPVGTSDLAILVAWGRRHRLQQVYTQLRALERAGVVKRHPPLKRGEGRPSWRWTLSRYQA